LTGAPEHGPSFPVMGPTTQRCAVWCQPKVPAVEYVTLSSNERVVTRSRTVLHRPCGRAPDRGSWLIGILTGP
jgi:hypothetical protein